MQRILVLGGKYIITENNLQEFSSLVQIFWVLQVYYNTIIARTS